MTTFRYNVGAIVLLYPENVWNPAASKENRTIYIIYESMANCMRRNVAYISVSDSDPTKKASPSFSQKCNIHVIIDIVATLLEATKR